MTDAGQLRSALEIFGSAHEHETELDEKRRLASAAFLFVQVAEHVERGKFLTEDLFERCCHANSLIRDARTRKKIEALLSTAARQMDMRH